MKIQATKKTLIICVLLLMSLGLTTSVLLYENSRLSQQVNDRDNLIDEIRNQKDSNTVRVDTLIQKIERKLSFTHGDKTISLDELLNISNQRGKDIDNLRDSLRYYKMYYKMVQEEYNHKFSRDSNLYTLSNIGVSKDSLLTIIDNKLRTIKDIEKSSAKLELQMKMYKKGSDSYNISYNNIRYEFDNDSVATSINYKISANKLDSALMLLPHYRKQLKYNEKDSTWTIGIKKFF